MSNKELLRKYFDQNKTKPKNMTWYEFAVSLGLSGTKEQITKLANDYYRRNKRQTIFKNPIVIGDLHLPFEREDYFEFCSSIYDSQGCDGAIFMGDIIDNHFASFHTTSPEAYGGAKELKNARKRLEKWYNKFPNAVVILGNHDRIVQRKLHENGIPKEWIKTFNDVLNVPEWVFTEEYHNNDVYYVHGVGSTAKTTALRLHKCVVQGHRHTECYIQYVAPSVFGVQCPTGIDKTKYAFEYMKYNTNPIYNGCLTFLNKQTPVMHLMS